MDENIIAYSARLPPQMPPLPATNPGSRGRQFDSSRNPINYNTLQQSSFPNQPTPRGLPTTAGGEKSGYASHNRANPRFRFRNNNKQAKPLSPVVINSPITPDDAISKYSEFLSDYEKEEIHSFPDIFYVGKQNKKITPDPNDEYNQGFDDDTNNYKLVVGDHLAYRFEILSLFGAGAFGQVARCFDHKTKSPVAVKVIVNTDQMHDQGRIEAKILSKLNSKEQHHIVRAYDFFIFRSHICITFEILGMNLFEYIEMNGQLPVRLVRLYALQMLSALEQCHRVGAIHCDIKPENVLLVQGSKTLVKLIDFGSSCFDGHQKYAYIQSRYYRAPEVILGLQYGPPMDIWSTALVLIELLIGRPIFPGEEETEQLWYIASLLGEPPKELVDQGNRKDEFFNEEGVLKEIANTIVPNSLDLQKYLQTNDTLLVDFLMRCLTWDPKERITAKQGLQHPWIRTKEVKLPQKKNNSGLPGLEPGLSARR